jgi:hypothetical protein
MCVRESAQGIRIMCDAVGYAGKWGEFTSPPVMLFEVECEVHATAWM